MNRKLFSMLLISCLICVSAPSPTRASEGESFSKDLRIAIVGAGASGLTAANTLKNLGYKNVTVFEKEGRVGGKVHSVKIDGYVYEMGAVLFGTDYETVYELADEYGVKDGRGLLTELLDMDGEQNSYLMYVLKNYGLFKFVADLTRFWTVMGMFPEIKVPGFVDLDSDLYLPFGEFVKKYNIELIGAVGQSFITGCGYGYYEEVPAMYILKLMPTVVDALTKYVLGNKDAVRTFPGGWQELWEAVAANNNVKLNSRVTDIVRYQEGGRSKVDVTAGGVTETFDKVIISAPLDKADTFMELSEEESDLFSKIETYRYAVTLIESGNLPHATIVDNVTLDTVGHVNAIAHFYPETDVFAFYQILSDDMTEAEADELLRQDVETLGGYLGTSLKKEVWDYFPHVNTENLEGYYERLSELQGQRGTYYVGGLLNFESVERTSQFAKHLIEQQFQREEVCTGFAWWRTCE